MSKEYAYIRTVPEIVTMGLNYQDGSKKLSVTCQPHKLDVIIKQGEESIILEVADIEWLRQALDDVTSYHKLAIPETNVNP